MEKPGILLYRGITPGAVGLDVHGGFGETWSRDFSVAKRFADPPAGYILEARLHPDAKQLILVTEEDEEGFSEYVEDGIRQLAKIVGWEWLFENLMSGHQLLWEVWEPEWTELLIQAGYDRIVTGGFDGPDEYVLNSDLLRVVHYHRVLAEGKTKAYPIEPGMLDELGYTGGLGKAV